MNKITKFKRIISLICVLTLSLSVFIPGNAAEDVNINNPEVVFEDVAPEVTEEVLPEVTETPEITEIPETTVTPEAIKEVTPTVTPEATKEVTPTATPEATKEVMPTATPEATKEVTPTATPEVTKEVTPTVTSEATKKVTPALTSIVTEKNKDSDNLLKGKYFDRYSYHPTENSISLMSNDIVEKDLVVNIRKRTQWVDETDGDAKITLQYSSNSGEISAIPDMNVVLIHDKSGSMDSNYGYNLEKVRKEDEWPTEPDVSSYYPKLFEQNWAETLEYASADDTSDIESMGAEGYMKRLNQPNEFTSAKGATTGYNHVSGSSETKFYNSEMRSNSPCQLEDTAEENDDNKEDKLQGHYYLLIQKDERSEIDAWTMVHGKHLYNLESTDLHHYVKLDSVDTAKKYLEAGRRVVRVVSGSYYSENIMNPIVDVFENEPESYAYFLDVTMLDKYDGKWILNTCGEEECQKNDRLSKSQEFLNNIVKKVRESNPNNQVAYVPFWGDVPSNGEWTNYNGTYDKNTGEYGIENINPWKVYIESYKGDKNGDGYDDSVSKVELSTNVLKVKDQLFNPFTYNGTNWSKAFENAVDIIKNNNETNKKTFVIFLTDGMPQGTEGQSSDYNNPFISGIKTDANDNLLPECALYQLKDINSDGKIDEKDNLSVWAVGVGINEQDKTGLKNRLKIVNDRKVDGISVPLYVRYTEEFNSLSLDVTNKIEEVFTEKIYGVDAFYQDTLSDEFELDQTNLDKTWKVIPESETLSGKSKKGVPEEVYNAVKVTDAEHVYVESTKTVYWYIDELSDGGYDTDGHTFEFPVKFLKYSEQTFGNDVPFDANTSQYITYYTNKSATDEPYKVEIDVPQIIFNRTDSEIVVNKEVSGVRNHDRSYRYVYSKTKYTNGKVKNVLGSFEIVISAGSMKGTGSIKGLEDGKYYIYEVDEDDVIINPTVCEATVDYNPTISTKDKDSDIPWAITKSDNGSVENIDNYLILRSKDAVSFQSADLTVVKEIDSADDIIWWEHGNPTFMVRVQGTGLDGKEYTFYHTFEFTKEYVKANESNGKVSMSYTFEDLPISEKYVVEEVKSSRYSLKTVSVEGQGGISVGTVNEKKAAVDSEFYGLSADVNLSLKPKGVSVVLCNQKVNYTWFNHVTSVKNVID